MPSFNKLFIDFYVIRFVGSLSQLRQYLAISRRSPHIANLSLELIRDKQLECIFLRWNDSSRREIRSSQKFAALMFPWTLANESVRTNGRTASWMQSGARRPSGKKAVLKRTHCIRRLEWRQSDSRVNVGLKTFQTAKQCDRRLIGTRTRGEKRLT